ncbi:MAG: hypothetical protein EA425_04955 [Puniceicoccaceae bacterium]|nr:MAG: hypothetical protein EA425_04955 [Puniceicoccaceae bacterium]
MLTKSLLALLLIALAETANGIVRVRLLSRRLGNRRARVVSLLSGCLLILLITWWMLPWIGPTSAGDALLIGALWLAGMVAYDIAVGRWAFGMRWEKIFADFDLRRGNYLALGMAWLFIAPVVVFLLG